ncbi:MAG: histidinol phosphate phosphatase domain-containing protein, partial [Candidatus Omnitrophica bacterium]|nr:histidinol phosphate phosphatase domain-containing protein [Candidatus Omnitrophota bacterium]
GALIVVGHGESPAEPVIKGTNRAAIEAGVDILAHPGNISPEDALLAAENGVYLEITSRRGHSFGNEHVFAEALKAGAEMVFNTDSHGPEDLMSEEKIQQIFGKLTGDARVKAKVLENSERLIKNLKI